MQHKGLFVALCCGALCLTGCIKNIESESVTKIREATASKLLSEAELNKAQAEAAKIKANAEATIADAQAKLIEAQAAKEEAEAKLIEAKAELQKINNEIAKVKLDEEREELKRKKAEVEKQIAEYEAAIAWAAVAQQAAIDMMEQMANEAELNALKHEVEMLQQKQNIVAEASKLNSDLRKRLIHVWDQYNDYSDKYYKAQAELILAQTRLARLEAGMESNYEATVEAIVEKQNEIAFLELQVEELESYVTFSSEEIKEFLKEAEMAMAAAKTAELEAAQTEKFILSQYNELKNSEGSYVYTKNWEPLVAFANSLIKTDTQNGMFKPQVKEIGGRDFAGLVYKGQFIPLFTGGIDPNDANKLQANTSVINIGEGFELYPESVEGKVPTSHKEFNETVYVPAYVVADSFDFFLSSINEDIDEEEEEWVEYWLEESSYAQRIEYYTEKVLPRLNEVYNEYVEYVEAAAPEVKAAYQAWEDATAQRTTADAEWTVTSQSIQTYKALHPEANDAMKAEWTAIEDAGKAQRTLVSAETKFESAVENLEELKDAVKELTDAKFLADSMVATAKVKLDTMVAQLNPETGSIGKPYKKAKDAVIAKRKAIAEQEDVVAAKLAAYRQAELNYIKDPTDDKRATTKAEWTTATTALATLNEELTPLLATLATAEGAFDKAHEEYLIAQVAYDELVRWAASISTELAAAQSDLGVPGENPTGAYKTLAQAKTAYENAKENYKTKIAALSAAHVANPGDVSEEFIQLVKDYIEAIDNYWAADKAVSDAWAEYQDLLKNKYPYYTQYKNQINPTGSSWIRDPEIGDVPPTQLYAMIQWYMVNIEELEKVIEGKIEQEHEYYDGLRAQYSAAETVLAKIKGNEEEYLTYVATLQAAHDEWEEAAKALIDAQNVSAEVEAKYKMLRALDLLHMKIYVDVTYDEAGNPVYVEHDITWVESVIKSLKAQIAEKEAELDKLMDVAQLGKLIEIDGKKVTELEAYAMLVAKIEKLESQINQYLALMDAYSAEIDIIMEAIESEADVD